MIDFRFILILSFLLLISNAMSLSYGQGYQNSVGLENTRQNFIDIGIPLLTLLVGAISAKYIVSSWQKRKEISDIRNKILINYTNSFKNYLTLLDTFVAKLVMEFAKLTYNKPIDKTALSELLPWGFTFNDIDFYSDKVPVHVKFTNYKNEKYDKTAITRKFEELQEAANEESYVNFDIKKLKEFRDKNELSFKNEFYNTRSKVYEFKANLSQYYGETQSSGLSDELSAMWEYMMGSYVLVNKILFTADEQKFVELLKKYNSLAEFSFDMMINFERKLICKRIKI